MIKMINSNKQRRTNLDIGKCLYLPLEQCQWCVMALRLSTTTSTCSSGPSS